MHRAPLVRHIERESRDRDFDPRAVGTHHVVGADHQALTRFERAPRCVVEALTRLQYRLLAYNPRPAHVLDPPEPVGDLPVSAAQLDDLVSEVADTDLVDPEILPRFRIRALWLENGLDDDLDSFGDGAIHRELRGTG